MEYKRISVTKITDGSVLFSDGSHLPVETQADIDTVKRDSVYTKTQLKQIIKAWEVFNKS